jgi:hypothetical protein
MMASPGAALAASQAAKSPAVHYLAAAVICALVLLVVGLLMLLGGGVAAQAAAAPAAPGVLRPGVVPAAYEALVQQAGLTCPGITAPLLAAQLEAESGWNPNAGRPVGAQGLAQFMPGTWTGHGVDGDGDGVLDPFDPADAIASQAAFMCRLLAAVTSDDSLTGDPIDLALAGYNVGLGAVQRHHGVPPYAETQGYIVRIRTLMATYADPAASAPGAGPPGTWILRSLARSPPTTARAGADCTRASTSGPGSAPRCTRPATAPCWPPDPPAATGAGSRSPTPAAPPPSTDTSAATPSRLAKPSSPASSSPTAATKAGPHLYFEVRPQERPVDPVAFYAAHGAELT